MPPPDWVTLRILVAAIELGSVTKAADRCGIAVSAAAKRVQDLEADLRVALFERGARGVRPTAAGEALARHARALLDLAARLADDMRAFAAGGVGSVRLHATASTIAGHDLAESLAAFAAARPGISVELHEDISPSILRDLQDGRADLGIVTTDISLPAALDAALWREDSLLVLVPEGHELAARGTLRFTDVLAQKLIGVLENGALALLLEQQARHLGRTIDFAFRVSGTDAGRRLVAAGLGVTIMPDGVARPYEAALGLRGVVLDEPWARRRLRLVARPAQSLPAPARLLRDHLLGA